MALSNKKLTITGDTIVDDAAIVNFVAAINLETGEMTIGERRISPEAIRENRDAVRDDRREFEDFAYSIQDDVKAILGLGGEGNA